MLYLYKLLLNLKPRRESNHLRLFVIKAYFCFLIFALFLYPHNLVHGSGSITITAPVDYQLFQRGANNQADINITGTYTETPTSIEASWNGGDYTTIVANPSGGTFSGTLSNQTGGQGTLTVRFTNDIAVSASQNYIGVGDIFVIAGQSNASGYAANLSSYSHATLKASLFGNDDEWKDLVDPTDSVVGQIDAISVNTEPLGSVWPLIATLYMADQNVPIGFIPAAKGGTKISSWQRNDANPGNVSTLYGSMHRRINAVGGIKAVLFWQGEADAVLDTGQASYKSQLTSFADDIFADFGIKLSNAMIGHVGTSDSSLNNIRLAVQSAWDEGGNILPGPALYDINILPHDGSPNDGIHFKESADLQKVANRWWSTLEASYYGGTAGRGPKVNFIESNSAKNQIAVTFTSDHLPLLPATNLGGFTAYDNGTPLTISSINRIAPDQLLITLSSAASGTLTLSFQTWSTTYEAWPANIPTDSSTYNLPADIFVDSTVSAASSPVISNITPTISSTTASFSWNTNEGASTKIEYGLTSSYGESTTESDTVTRVTSHSDSLSDLSTCATYHYRLVSNDNVSNQGTSADATLTTTGCTGSASVDAQTSSNITTASGGSIDLLSGDTGITLIAPASFSESDANFQITKLDETSVLDTTSIPSGVSVVGSYIYDLKALSDVSTSISTFDEPITISLTYEDSDVPGIDESSLQIYRWDGSNWNQLSGCSTNTSTKTVSCTTVAFSVFGLFGQESTSNTPSSSSGSPSSTLAPSCGEQAPGAKAPWLYGGVAQDSGAILLYFTEADNPVSKYVLEYGIKSGDYSYNILDLGVNSRGPMTFLVKSLAPDTTYYFRVRAENGCAAGPWSNEIPVKTKMLVSFDQLEVTQPALEVQPTEETSKEEVPETEAPAQTGYNIRVKVVDTNKKPVEGVKIAIHSEGQGATTNEDGIAEFKNIERGEHRVLISYDNFEGEQAVNLTGDVKTFDLNITIQEKRAALSPLVQGIIGVMGIMIIALTIFFRRFFKKSDKRNYP